MSKPFTSFDRTANEQITRVTRDRKGGHQGAWISGGGWVCGNTQGVRKFSKHTKKRLLRREHKKATERAVVEFQEDQAARYCPFEGWFWEEHFEFSAADELNPEFREEENDAWYYASYRGELESYRQRDMLEEYNAERIKERCCNIVVGYCDVGLTMKQLMYRNGFELCWSYREERWMIVPKM
jgi:hypothetical protein